MKAVYEIEVFDKDGTFLQQDERPADELGKPERRLREIADTYFDLFANATCVDIRVIYQRTSDEEPTNDQ